MEKIPEDPILEFNKDTLQEVRKMYDLDKPGRIKEAIDILETWIQKQDHFKKKDFNREYLERTLIATKGSVERAKKQLDKVCTLRGLMPNLFGDYDVRTHFKDYYYKIFTHGALPKLTPDHYRVFFLKNSGNYDAKVFIEYYRIFIIFCEYLRAHDYANGYIYICDYSELNLAEFAMKLNPMELRGIITLMMEGYGVRIKGIHIITQSKFVDAVITIFKQVFSAKIASRIYVHKNIESLHSMVPKEILPKDYGGEELPIKELHDKWVDVLASDEHTKYQREMNAASTDESRRQADSFNEKYMGMPGTFRSLNVD